MNAVEIEEAISEVRSESPFDAGGISFCVPYQPLETKKPQSSS